MKIVIIGIFLALTSVVFGGEQRVDIRFIPTFKGASTQVVGDNQVIDLGFLKDGQSYVGANRIDIGTVSVSISQKKTGSEDACTLQDIQFDSVNITRLKTMTEQITSIERSYIGDFSGMTLSAGGVSNVTYTGTLVNEGMDAYFTDSTCTLLTDEAIFTLNYEFKLYAEIQLAKHGVAGAFAQDKNQKELALKDIIIRQISGSVGGSAGNRNRRR